MRAWAGVAAVALVTAGAAVLLGGSGSGREHEPPARMQAPGRAATDRPRAEPAARTRRRARAWRPRTGAARAYARRRGDGVSFAVRRGRHAWSFHGRAQAHSASTVKALLLAAYLRSPDMRSRELGAAEAATLDAMITRSDNDAATAIHAVVGGEGLAAAARSAGMRDFAAAPAWGASRLTAADGARLMLRFERVVPRRHRTRALALLARVVPEQRWGIARAAPRGWRLHFKGGWAPATADAPAVNHQLALLRRGRRRVALAILTSGRASQARSSETLRGVAARLLRGLGRR